MTSAHWKGLRLKAANLVAYSLFSVAVIRTGVILPWYPYGDVKQTYITPGVWAFFAWPVIYLTLLGTVIYQFTSAHAKAVVIDGISWRCPLMILFSAITITVRENHDYNVAFVFSLSLFLTSTFNYGLIKVRYPSKSVGDELFVHIPFSIWQGWASVVVVCSAFEAFGVDAAKHHDGAWTKVSVFLAL